MKQRIVLIFAVVLGGLSIIGAGCSQINSSDVNHFDSGSKEKIKIAAAIFPLYDIAGIVAGDDAEVLLIAPPGASPHYFDPTPSLLKEMQGTDFIFKIGAGLDDWVEGLTSNIDGAEIVDISKKVSLKKSVSPHLHKEGESVHAQEIEGSGHEEGGHKAHEHSEHGAHGHVHGDFDPHYWLDPMIAKDMAMYIAEKLAQSDGAHAGEYVQRANMFAAELAKKDIEWKALVAELVNKEIVTFHNAFMYFAEHFGLTIVATFEPFPGKEPTAQYLAGLRDEIDAHSISTLFLEPQMSKSSIESFAKDYDLSVGVLDPLGGINGVESYIDIIEYNLRSIVGVNK